MNADMGVLDAAKGDLTDLMRRDRGEHARIPWGLSARLAAVDAAITRAPRLSARCLADSPGHIPNGFRALPPGGAADSGDT
jgi:hypothetical protein